MRLRQGEIQVLFFFQVTNDGKVYGVNSGKLLFLRVGVTPNRPTGTGWKHISSQPLTHVSAGNLAIWSIDFADSIYDFTG